MQLDSYTRHGARYSHTDEGHPDRITFKTGVGRKNVDLNGDGSQYAPYDYSGNLLRYGDAECDFADGWQQIKSLGQTIVSQSRIYIQQDVSGTWTDVPHGNPTRNIQNNYPSEGKCTAYLDFPDIQGYAAGARFQCGIEVGGSDKQTCGFRMRSPVSGTFRLEWVIVIPDNVNLSWINEPTSKTDPTPIHVGGRIGPVEIRWSRSEAQYRDVTIENSGPQERTIHIFLGPYSLDAMEWLTVYPDSLGPYTPAVAADDGTFFYYESAWNYAVDQYFFGTYSSVREWGWWRFILDGDLPDGSTITAATLTVTCSGAHGTNSFYFYTQDSSDAVQMSVATDRPSMDGGNTATLPNAAEDETASYWSGTYPTSGTQDFEIKEVIQLLVDKYSGLSDTDAVGVFGSGELPGGGESGWTDGNTSLTITYTSDTPPATPTGLQWSYH